MEKSKSDTLFRLSVFSKHLYNSLYPPLYKGIKQIWEASKKEARPGHVWQTFQEHLKNIPKWNQDLIDKVYQRVVQNIRFENITTPEATTKHLNDLITKVFLLTTEMLADLPTGEKIMVKVPPGSRFVHNCYKECARQFYGRTYLMEDRPQHINSLKNMENMRECNELIVKCIENAVTRSLPLDSLLDQRPVQQAIEERPESPADHSPVRSRSRVSRSRSHSRSRVPSPVLRGRGSDIDDLFEAESDVASDVASNGPEAAPVRGRSPGPGRENQEASDDTMTVRFKATSTKNVSNYPESSEEYGYNLPKTGKASSVIDTDDLPALSKKEESTFDFSKQEAAPTLDKDFDALNFFDDV